MHSTFHLLSLVAALTSAAPLTKQHIARQFAGSNGTTGTPNPTYTQAQLDRIKLSLSAVDKFSYIQSLGDTDSYFKFDYSPQANPNPVAGAGQGGQGDLSYVDNWPALLGSGVAMSMGFMNPCTCPSNTRSRESPKV